MQSIDPYEQVRMRAGLSIQWQRSVPKNSTQGDILWNFVSWIITFQAVSSLKYTIFFDIFYFSERKMNWNTKFLDTSSASFYICFILPFHSAMNFWKKIPPTVTNTPIMKQICLYTCLATRDHDDSFYYVYIFSQPGNVKSEDKECVKYLYLDNKLDNTFFHESAEHKMYL